MVIVVVYVRLHLIYSYSYIITEIDGIDVGMSKDDKRKESHWMKIGMWHKLTLNMIYDNSALLICIFKNKP